MKDHTTEQNKNLQNTNGETGGIIKLSQKIKINENELHGTECTEENNYNFYDFLFKTWLVLKCFAFPGFKKPFSLFC